MHVWVDVHPGPKPLVDIIHRMTTRLAQPVTLVVKEPIASPQNPKIETVFARDGFDVGDDNISQRLKTGDCVITSDLSLASILIESGCIVLTPKGDRLDNDNIQEHLGFRNFMDTLRAGGVNLADVSTIDEDDEARFIQTLESVLKEQSSTT